MSHSGAEGKTMGDEMLVRAGEFKKSQKQARAEVIRRTAEIWEVAGDIRFPTISKYAGLGPTDFQYPKKSSYV